MRNFLLGLILTLAVAASVIVIVDRFRDGGGPENVEDLRSRLARIEDALGAPAPNSEPGASTAGSAKSDARPVRFPGQVDLSEVVDLLEEVEGMILDTEKSLRRDLRGVYEKLLARLEEVAASGAPSSDSPAAREALRMKLKEMGVKVHGEEMVEMEGQILEPSRALELIAVAPDGRDHEALLTMNIIPSALKIALEDIGLVETDADRNTGRYPENGKGSAYIYVTWDKLKKPRRVEDLILNRATNDTMKRTPFMFTASRFYTDTRTWERHFAADVYRNVISLTWNWSVESILACPLEEAANENIWAPCTDTCAKAGTKVRIFIRNAPHPIWDKL